MTLKERACRTGFCGRTAWNRSCAFLKIVNNMQEDMLWKQLAAAKWGQKAVDLGQIPVENSQGGWFDYCKHRLCIRSHPYALSAGAVTCLKHDMKIWALLTFDCSDSLHAYAQHTTQGLHVL